MTVSIHEHEAVVAERDALRREVAALRAEIDRLTTTQPEKREDLHCVISDLCTKVRDMEAHYKAALEAEQVRFRQLAASQAREQRLREALSAFSYRFPESSVAKDALAAPTDTTALQAYVTMTSELMRKRAAQEGWMSADGNCEDRVRREILSIANITLDDLKGGA